MFFTCTGQRDRERERFQEGKTDDTAETSDAVASRGKSSATDDNRDLVPLCLLAFYEPHAEKLGEARCDCISRHRGSFI